jgi:hypothetical protein
MPLSVQERRRLDEIEQALVAEDPGFVAAISAGRRPTLIFVLIGLVALLGAVILVAGLVTTHAFPITGSLIGIAGVAVMGGAAARLHRELTA